MRRSGITGDSIKAPPAEATPAQDSAWQKNATALIKAYVIHEASLVQRLRHKLHQTLSLCRSDWSEGAE